MDVRVLVAAVICAGGCGRAADSEGAHPKFPPVEPIPVAPVGASPVAMNVSEPPLPPPLDAGITAVDDAAAQADVAPLPARSPRILLVDEPPFSPAFARAAPTSATTHGKHHGRHGRPFHAAPRIVVDVTEGDGGGDLQRVARDLGYWPFRSCYEEGLRREAQLAGKVAFRVFVSSAGTVERSAALPSSLGDPVVAACIAREARRLQFVSGAGERAAVLEVTLATGDEPVFAPPPLANAGPLREALRASWTSVEQCYADRLAKAPDLGGRMELHFRVQPSGEVSEVAEGEPRFGDLDVTRCVLGVYRTSKLPADAAPPRHGHEHGSRGSADGAFVYPLHFEASDAAPEGR